MADYMLAGEGALWIQPDGLNTKPQYLGCHEMGDISEGVGDIKLFYCPDPSVPNRWNVVGSFQGEPGAVTSSIATDMNKTGDYLEKQKCPFPLYVLKKTCGKKSNFNGWDRAFVLNNTYITKRGLSKMTAKEPGNQDRSVMTFDITAELMKRFWQFESTRTAFTDTENLVSVYVCGEDSCSGDCGSATYRGANAHVATDVKSGSPGNSAEVWSLNNPSQVAGGAGINAQIATAPFTGKGIATVECLIMSETVTRLIAVVGSANGFNTVAYSDDAGTTWTLVALSTTGLYGVGPKCLLVKDFYNIWLCLTAGWIYFSSDGGASWTAQHSATLTFQSLYAMAGYDNYRIWCVGGANPAAGNVILRTTDGSNWELITGPATQTTKCARAVGVSGRDTVWVGYDDGKLFYTTNSGLTWTQRTWSLSSTTTTQGIRSMEWYNEFFAVFVYNTSTPLGSVWVTINGGYDWESITLPGPNAGLNDVSIASELLMYVVGMLYGGTGYFLTIEAR